jgi:hypothetical protein
MVVTVDLEERMTRYAQGHVTSMTREYESQRNKWIGFYNVAADAQKNACTAVETVITNAQKKHEYYAQLAMLGLSLISGVALAGLATVIEKNLFSLMQNTEIRLLRNKYRIPRIQLIRFEDDNYTKIAAKYWGDGIKKMVEDQVDRAIPLVVAPPNSYKMPTALGAAVLAGDFVSFKTQLENTLIDESRVMTDTFGALDAKINQSQEFGAAVLSASQRQSGNLSMNDYQREQAGRKYLDEFFDKIRKYGYQNWFYYGNDPETNNVFLSKKIEKIVWQVWILDQNFKRLWNRGDVGGNVYWAEGKDGIKLDEDILDHLVNDLGVTVLYDVYWEVYSRLSGRQIEDADGLAKVNAWAKNHVDVASILGSTPRPFVSITDLARLFPKAVPLPFGLGAKK